eukprot:1155036-Amphidinium_carterae.1
MSAARVPKVLTFQEGKSKAGLQHVKVLVFDNADGEPDVYVQFRELATLVWQAGHAVKHWTDCCRSTPSRMAESKKWSSQKIQQWGCEKEILVSIRFLFAQLLHWIGSAQLKFARAIVAAHLLDDLLREVLCNSNGINAHEVWNGTPAQTGFLAEWITPAGVAVSTMATLLTQSFSVRQPCDCFKSWRDELLNMLVLSWCQCFLPPERWSLSAAQIVSTRTLQRKRARLDQDTVHGRLVELTETKKCKTARDAASAGVVDVSATGAIRSDRQQALLYLTACQQTFTGRGLVRIATDASTTVGGENTLLAL